MNGMIGQLFYFSCSFIVVLTIQKTERSVRFFGNLWFVYFGQSSLCCNFVFLGKDAKDRMADFPFF